jgi:hypothetical protein
MLFLNQKPIVRVAAAIATSEAPVVNAPINTVLFESEKLFTI